jgi:hypothetical protein
MTARAGSCASRVWVLIKGVEVAVFRARARSSLCVQRAIGRDDDGLARRDEAPTGSCCAAELIERWAVGCASCAARER